MDFSTSAREIDARERETAIRARLGALGLKLVPPSATGPFGVFQVVHAEGGAAFREFGSVEELEQFIAERPATKTWKVQESETRPPAGVRPVRTVPYVGQAVHYVSLGSADGRYPSLCRAAIVTELLPETAGLPAGTYRANEVGLSVHNPTGQFFNLGVQFDPGIYAHGERTMTAGGQVQLITCDDLRYEPGTWHFIAHPEAP